LIRSGLCKLWKERLTHVCFVLESIFASTTVKMCRTLSVEDTMLNETFFRGSISLKSLLINCRVFPMVIWMHLNIACWDVNLVAFILDTMVMRLFAIMLTITVLYGAIIWWCESQKSMTEWFCSFFVPFKMTNDLFLFVQYLVVALNIIAMIMITLILTSTFLITTFSIRLVFCQIFWVFSCELLLKISIFQKKLNDTKIPSFSVFFPSNIFFMFLKWSTWDFLINFNWMKLMKS
jgi:hypothetical protein